MKIVVHRNETPWQNLWKVADKYNRLTEELIGISRQALEKEVVKAAGKFIYLVDEHKSYTPLAAAGFFRTNETLTVIFFSTFTETKDFAKTLRNLIFSEILKDARKKHCKTICMPVKKEVRSKKIVEMLNKFPTAVPLDARKEKIIWCHIPINNFADSCGLKSS